MIVESDVSEASARFDEAGRPLQQFIRGLHVGTTRRCDQCGRPYQVTSSVKRYCRSRCQPRADRDIGLWRARRLGLATEVIPRFLLHSRDSWLCHICGEVTVGEAGDRTPLAPSFDHVIPLDDPACPGHIWENVRTAHLACNQRKGNRSMAEFVEWMNSTGAARGLVGPDGKVTPVSVLKL